MPGYDTPSGDLEIGDYAQQADAHLGHRPSTHYRMRHLFKVPSCLAEVLGRFIPVVVPAW
jgi:hypothetical protein